MPFRALPHRYKVQKEFFPSDVFLAMKTRLVNSDIARAPNALNEDSFGKRGSGGTTDGLGGLLMVKV